VTAFIDSKRGDYGVEFICRTLEVSASAYYQRATGERSARQIEDERLLAVILQTHKDNYFAYGYRKMWKTLLRAGESVSRCRVKRLMAANGIQGAKRRGKPWRTTIPDPGAPRRPDLVNRDFTAQAPDRLWVGDFTYLRCWEGKLYFSFVIDVFSRKIVGWQLAAHMRTDLVLDALRMALGTRSPGAEFTLVTHTDAGSQYTSHDYTQVIDDHRVLASVGSVGDAYDNAMAESFVDTFKTELIKDRVWRTRTQLELAVLEYVDWFNNRRLHQSLADIPPVEFETNWATATTPIAPDPEITVNSARPSAALTTPRPDPGEAETGVPAPDQPEIDAERPGQNGSWEEPGPAKIAPSLVVDETSQLVSLPLRI
jgi:transposase InsO family protein